MSARQGSAGQSWRSSAFVDEFRLRRIWRGCLFTCGEMVPMTEASCDLCKQSGGVQDGYGSQVNRGNGPQGWRKGDACFVSSYRCVGWELV